MYVPLGLLHFLRSVMSVFPVYHGIQSEFKTHPFFPHCRRMLFGRRHKVDPSATKQYFRDPSTRHSIFGRCRIDAQGR